MNIPKLTKEGVYILIDVLNHAICECRDRNLYLQTLNSNPVTNSNIQENEIRKLQLCEIRGVLERWDDVEEPSPTNESLTKLDQFALMVANRFVINPANPSKPDKICARELAINSYDTAEAFLAESKRRNG